MTFFAGDELAAADLNAMLALFPLTAYKSSDTARASTTSVSTDPALTIAVPAGLRYTFVANIAMSGDATADLVGGIQVPSGGTFQGTIRAQPSGASATSGVIVTDLQAAATNFTFGLLGSASQGSTVTALFVGSVYSGSGGNVFFTWAQKNTSTTATTVRAGSFMTLFPNP